MFYETKMTPKWVLNIYEVIQIFAQYTLFQQAALVTLSLIVVNKITVFKKRNFIPRCGAGKIEVS